MNLLWKKFLLLITSLILAFLFIELGFHLLVKKKMSSYDDVPFATSVMSEPLFEYDAEFGYRYIPNKTNYVVGVSPIHVRYCWIGKVNSEGNIGNVPLSWNKDDLKILVVGDSCSAFPYGPNGPITWTDFLTQEISGFVPTSVSVKNFSRRSYGLIQMVHMAARKIEEFNPDILIIAFITDDLSRGRFWEHVVSDGKKIKSFRSYTKRNNVDLNEDLYSYSFIPQVDKNSCSLEKQEQEELIENIYDNYFSLRNQERSINRNYSNQFGVYLFNLIINKVKPGERKEVGRVSLADLENDGEFLSDLKTLRNYKGKKYFMHLPLFFDLKKGKYEMNKEDQRILKFIERELGETSMTIIDDYPTNEKELEKYFLFPFDVHPSEKGARHYAKNIAKSIKNDL